MGSTSCSAWLAAPSRRCRSRRYATVSRCGLGLCAVPSQASIRRAHDACTRRPQGLIEKCDSVSWLAKRATAAGAVVAAVSISAGLPCQFATRNGPGADGSAPRNPWQRQNALDARFRPRRRVGCPLRGVSLFAQRRRASTHPPNSVSRRSSSSRPHLRQHLLERSRPHETHVLEALSRDPNGPAPRRS